MFLLGLRSAPNFSCCSFRNYFPSWGWTRREHSRCSFCFQDFFKRKIAIFQRRRGGLVYIQDEAVCYKSRRLDCRKIGGDLRINVSAVKNTSRLKDYQCDKVLLHTRKCSRKDDFRTRQSLVTKSRLCCWTCRKTINI